MKVEKIGPYELKRTINKGAFGQVYLAQLPQRDGSKPKALVLKVPRPSGVVDPIADKMFRQEIEIALMLVHSNIVAAFDSGIDNGIRYLVLNYVNGASLKQLNQQLRGARDKWTFPAIAQVGRDMLHALSYAHRLKVRNVPQNIIHRDIKPANILVDGQGNVLLTDFGVATAFSFTSAVPGLKGTLRYMAPEQAKQRATAKSDIFSVGATLHEMVEGVRFRDGDHTEAQLYELAEQGYVPPITREEPYDGSPGWTPTRMRDAIEWMLRLDEADRSDADQVLKIFETYLPARTTVKEIVIHHAGQDATRTGHTLVDFETPSELELARSLAQAFEEGSEHRPETEVNAPLDSHSDTRKVSGTIIVRDRRLPDFSETDAPIQFRKSPPSPPENRGSEALVSPKHEEVNTEGDDTPMHWLDGDEDPAAPLTEGGASKRTSQPDDDPSSTLVLPPWPPRSEGS